VTCVRTAAIRIGAALTIAAAGLISTHAIANAEPVGHQVRYTITTGLEVNYNLYYLATEPESKAAYDANPNAYLRNERVTIAPGAPWVFETTLKDTSWAYVNAGKAVGYQGAPNPHCDIAIDGNVVAQQDGESVVTCALKPW
jgi:hypothetical protein